MARQVGRGRRMVTAAAEPAQHAHPTILKMSPKSHCEIARDDRKHFHRRSVPKGEFDIRNALACGAPVKVADRGHRSMRLKRPAKVLSNIN
jgi:hypothetical protein